MKYRIGLETHMFLNLFFLLKIIKFQIKGNQV